MSHMETLTAVQVSSGTDHSDAGIYEIRLILFNVHTALYSSVRTSRTTGYK